jgi:hypothetical protein
MSDVEKQRANNGKITGGVTGKGFVAGQSGNPKGRPKKGFAIADILNAKSEEIDEVTGESMREKMLHKVYALATSNKPERWAVEFIADRTEGKAVERIDQTLKHEPIRVFDFDD